MTGGFSSSQQYYVLLISFKIPLGVSMCVTNHEVADSIPGTSTDFKCGLGLERGPPSLVRILG